MQKRSWAVNEDPCNRTLLPHRRFGLPGPPVHVPFNNPGRLGNRLFQELRLPLLTQTPTLLLSVDIREDTRSKSCLTSPGALSVSHRTPNLAQAAAALILANRTRSPVGFARQIADDLADFPCAPITMCSVRATSRPPTGPTTRTCPLGVLAGRTPSSAAAT